MCLLQSRMYPGIASWKAAAFFRAGFEIGLQLEVVLQQLYQNNIIVVSFLFQVQDWLLGGRLGNLPVDLDELPEGASFQFLNGRLGGVYVMGESITFCD